MYFDNRCEYTFPRKRRKQIRNPSAPWCQLQFRFHLGEMLEIPIIVQERNALVDGRRSDQAVVAAAWRYTLRCGVTGFAHTIV
jgi:hypothetical protein